jgi:hypothetical protein
MFKKLFYFSIILIASFNLTAQVEREFEVVSPDGVVNLRNVGNFTIIDSEGVTWTLYDELDNGRTVMIDIFQAT